MKKIQHIAIAGYSGAGKSSAAKIFADYGNYAEYAFADHLKACLIKYSGVESDYFYHPKLKDKPLSRLGGHSPRVWLTTFHKHIVALNPELPVLHAKENINWKRPVLISDLRLEAELNFILEHRIKIVCIKRHLPDFDINHKYKKESEIFYPNIEKYADYIIINDSTLAGLELACIKVHNLLDTTEESIDKHRQIISAEKCLTGQ